MPENNEVNVVKMLIDISGRLSRVEENTKGLHHTDSTAVEALSLAQQNKENIKKINDTSTWAFRTAIAAVLIPVGVFLIEKFL